MLPDQRIFQASVRKFRGGSWAHNTLGSFVCLWRARVSERRGGSESETCTDGWPPCMGFYHLLASCCPPFTSIFLWGREGVLLGWQGLKFALLQTRPHPVLIQDLLAYTLSHSRTTQPQLSISPSPTHRLLQLPSASVTSLNVSFYFTPFWKRSPVFHIAFWRWYCNRGDRPWDVCLYPPQHKLKWKQLQLCR